MHNNKLAPEAEAKLAITILGKRSNNTGTVVSIRSEWKNYPYL